MLKILYQDPAIVVCEKPFRVLSTDEPGGMPDCIRQALGRPEAEVRTVHRLDQVVGPQGDLPLRGIGVLAVLPVPRQGEAPGRELGPDLMGPPGLQPDGHQGEPLAAVHHPVVEDGLLDAFAGEFGHVGLSGLGVAAQQVQEGALLLPGPPVDHR